jgi:hypothetical protein
MLLEVEKIMSECIECFKNPKHPDKKCCFNCAKNISQCDTLHCCGDDCFEWEQETNFSRIKNMTVGEMAEFFAIDKYPNFPSSPCYICEHDRGMFCNKPSNCTDEDKIRIYQKWLESKTV